MGETADALAAPVVQALAAAGLSVAVAESLTGGLITAALTEVPGSSAVVRGGVVVYATELKSTLAGVDPRLLEARGPVHEEIAQAMAVGVRDALGASLGVATTGVAGPDRQDGQPAGTVHVAVASLERTITRSFIGDSRLHGDRQVVRAATVRVALRMIDDTIQDHLESFEDRTR